MLNVRKLMTLIIALIMSAAAGFVQAEVLQPVGLKNLGNTCYFNVIVQMFRNLPGFRQSLDDTHGARSPLVDSLRAFLATSNPTLAEVREKSDLRSQRKSIEFLENEALRCGGDLAPISLAFEALERRQQIENPFDQSLRRFYDSAYANAFRRSDKYAQEDPAELLTPMLDALSISGVTRFDFTENNLKQCDVCKTGRTVGVPKHMLELTIPSRVRSTTLEDLLGFYCSPEVMDGENAVDCDTCRKKTRTTSKMNWVSSPDTLIIQLKRFDNRGNKVVKPVTLPDILDMSRYVHAQDGHLLVYALKGIIYHNGDTAQHGHYVASFLDASGIWVYFDDETACSFVREAEKLGNANANPKEQSPNGGTPYILVYEKVNISDPVVARSVKAQISHQGQSTLGMNFAQKYEALKEKIVFCLGVTVLVGGFAVCIYNWLKSKSIF